MIGDSSALYPYPCELWSGHDGACDSGYGAAARLRDRVAELERRLAGAAESIEMRGAAFDHARARADAAEARERALLEALAYLVHDSYEDHVADDADEDDDDAGPACMVCRESEGHDDGCSVERAEVMLAQADGPTAHPGPVDSTKEQP
jgi:hypothetical protein